ncbi:flagellar biosynthesis anti-sigma factor FlgM [Ferrovum sp.]|uniref:flagellar biosynthesis anti-sigma factor FlgM n=1 Tax=Ferrovum sp. TaxID=2609467 RepID=UPI00260F8818|nr:flagellar biosynthesis anti-sigma factor FlgM [Ferrovum sp.]
MKIDKTVKSAPPTPIQGGSGRTSSASTSSSSSPQGARTTSEAGTAASGAASGTTVHIGGTATQLKATIAATSSVDLSKVAAVRQAISEGRFQVNAHAVASGLIASVKSLIQASGH